MFEIQEYTLCDGWINTWSYDDGKPVVFSSYEEANQELKDFLLDQRKAVEDGDMAEKYSLEDYRIIPVTKENKICIL